MPVVLALLLLLLLPAAARADFTVAPPERPTPVTAYAGHVVWSQSGPTGYRLMEAHASPSGLVTTALPVPPRRVPFDADLGPDAAGAPTVVYSRCATEPVTMPGSGLPSWATGRGCDIYRFTLGGTRERREAAIDTSTASEFLPTLWRNRIGFARRYEQRSGTRGIYPYLYVRGTTTERQPGGARGSTGLPGPTALDLAGIRLAVTWGLRGRTDIRLDTVGGGHELLAFATPGEFGTSLRSAFVFAGRVWWLQQASAGANQYLRRQISSEHVDRAPVPPTRLATIAIAPQSAASVFWSQTAAGGACPCLVGGDGSAAFSDD